jgi:hypothetical protein
LEVIRIFKELGGCEKLVGVLTSTQSEAVRARLLVCFQTLTSAGEDQELLNLLKDLNFIPLILEMLQQKNEQGKASNGEAGQVQGNGMMIGSILTTLTNISLNDATN